MRETSFEPPARVAAPRQTEARQVPNVSGEGTREIPPDSDKVAGVREWLADQRAAGARPTSLDLVRKQGIGQVLARRLLADQDHAEWQASEEAKGGGIKYDEASGELHYDPVRLAKAMNLVRSNGGDGRLWAWSAVGEEILHHAETMAHPPGKVGEEREAIYDSLPPANREEIARAYGDLTVPAHIASKPGQADAFRKQVLAAEYMRALAQRRAGEPLTESHFRDTKALETMLDGPQPAPVEKLLAKMSKLMPARMGAETEIPGLPSSVAPTGPRSTGVAPEGAASAEPSFSSREPTAPDVASKGEADIPGVPLSAAKPAVDENGVHDLAKPQASKYLSEDERQRDPAHVLQAIVRNRRATGESVPWKPGRAVASHSELLAWAHEHGAIFDPKAIGPGESGGNEHALTYDALSGRYFKQTKPGLYGAQAQDAGAYLQRWALHNRVLGDDAQFEGFVQHPDESEPRAVISQPFREGAPAGSEQLAEYLRRKGFREQPDGKWINPVTGLAVWDAQTPGNARTTPGGEVQPVDLQITPASPEDLRRVREESGIGEQALFAANPLRALWQRDIEPALKGAKESFEDGAAEIRNYFDPSSAAHMAARDVMGQMRAE